MDGNKQNIITPDLATLFKLKITGALVDMNCISLGTIQSFNSTLQTATISINYKRKVGSNFIDYPLLVDCPVVFLTGGSAVLTMPVAKGDTCLVMFCDRDIDTWFVSGQVAEPNSRRIHSINDGIALVGIRSKQNPIENFNTIIASLKDQSGERFSQSGDTKYSYRSSNHSGWLILDGKTIGNDDSGADYTGAEFEELFNILKDVSPNAGSEVFGDDDTVSIPDERGRGSVAADNMGGNQAGVLTSPFTPNRNVLGGEIGEESHLLTGQESGVQLHNHPASGFAVAPGATTNFGHTSSLADPRPLVTGNAGHTNALNKHNNVPPGSIKYAFIKI